MHFIWSCWCNSLKRQNASSLLSQSILNFSAHSSFKTQVDRSSELGSYRTVGRKEMTNIDSFTMNPEALKGIRKAFDHDSLLHQLCHKVFFAPDGDRYFFVIIEHTITLFLIPAYVVEVDNKGLMCPDKIADGELVFKVFERLRRKKRLPVCQKKGGIAIVRGAVHQLLEGNHLNTIIETQK